VQYTRGRRGIQRRRKKKNAVENKKEYVRAKNRTKKDREQVKVKLSL
jgi:hypothetical protein